MDYCQSRELENCPVHVFHHFASKTSPEIAATKLNQFIKDYGDKTKILIFNPIEHVKCSGEKLVSLKKDGYTRLRLCATRPKGEEYIHIHPPSYVYHWYGKYFSNFFVPFLKSTKNN